MYKKDNNLPNKTSKKIITTSTINYSAFSNQKVIFYENKLASELDKSSNSNININNLEIKTNLFKYNVADNPIDELSKVNNVIIKIEYDDCCCLNQTNNLYSVFTKNNTDVKYLFRAKELMACSDYSCCDYIQIPFFLDIEHIINIKNEEVNSEKFAVAKKYFKIPCLCFCRPEIKVKLNQNKRKIGKIVFPYSYGDTKYKIYNDKEILKYVVDTEYCQPGILFTKNCCGYLPDVVFDICNDNEDSIGTIERRPAAFEEFMRVLDCYHIFFPKDASFEDKFLLICASFMIENQLFKDKWGSLDCCGGYCECCEDCCADFGSRCFGEICASCFRC